MKNLSTLNFNSLLIISYGRSGSTLLQGVLNSIEGVVIRGENFDMCFHLFGAYKAILDTKKQSGSQPQNSFYGSELLDEAYFLSQIKETVRNLLLPNNQNEVRCYGFKEIRYGNNLKTLPEFLDFLQKIFPNCGFIFNTRNKEDVIKSWINLKWRSEEESDKMHRIFENIESAFFEYLNAHKKNCFHITYEDVIGKKERLQDLFSFLGVNYEEDKIDALLNVRHSHKPNQEHIEKLPHERAKKSSFLKRFLKK